MSRASRRATSCVVQDIQLAHSAMEVLGQIVQQIGDIPRTVRGVFAAVRMKVRSSGKRVAKKVWAVVVSKIKLISKTLSTLFPSPVLQDQWHSAKAAFLEGWQPS